MLIDYYKMPQEIQRLLDQFKCLYETKLSDVDKICVNNVKLTKEQSLQMKIDILQAYVTDLAEQNLHLVQTAAVLQTEAENRCVILEKLLEKTTVASKDFVQKISLFNQEDCEKNKSALFIALKSKFHGLEEERDELKKYSSYLTRQISTLIHVISKARNTGSWDFLGSELEELDNFSPVEKLSSKLSLSEELISCKESFNSNDNGKLFQFGHSLSPSLLSVSYYRDNPSGLPVTDKDVIIKQLRVDLKVLEKNHSEKCVQLLAKDGSIANLQSQISELQQELMLKESECALHLHALSKIYQQPMAFAPLKDPVLKFTSTRDAASQAVEDLNNGKKNQQEHQKLLDILNGCIVKKEVLIQELQQKLVSLQNQIENTREDYGRKLQEEICKSGKYQEENEKLKEELDLLEKSAHDTRVILTKEIAERHDTINALQQELAEQSEHHKEIVQQLVLKCEVIKGLRKDLKNVETKLETCESEIVIQREKLEAQNSSIAKQTSELENQKITIANLQDALVQRKRMPFSNVGSANGTSAKARNSNGNDIIDI